MSSTHRCEHNPFTLCDRIEILFSDPINPDDNTGFVTLYDHQDNGLTNGKWDMKLFLGVKKLPIVSFLLRFTWGYINPLQNVAMSNKEENFKTALAAGDF